MSRNIIKKAEIDAMAAVEKVHFLNDNAIRYHKSLGDVSGISGFGFHLVEIPAGKESTEYHIHRDEDECVYIISGEAEVLIGDQATTVSAGDFIGYPANDLPHTMRNMGDSPLKYILVGERLAHDVVDYPNQGKRLYRSKERPGDVVDHSAIGEAKPITKAD